MQTYDAIIKLMNSLSPLQVDLVNESINHSGYFEGKESHFKLTIVSEDFVDKRPVARHQMIYALVNHLMIAQGGSIHALAIHAHTPEEWDTLNQSVPASPLCAGQNKA